MAIQVIGERDNASRVKHVLGWNDAQFLELRRCALNVHRDLRKAAIKPGQPGFNEEVWENSWGNILVSWVSIADDKDVAIQALQRRAQRLLQGVDPVLARAVIINRLYNVRRHWVGAKQKAAKAANMRNTSPDSEEQMSEKRIGKVQMEEIVPQGDDLTAIIQGAVKTQSAKGATSVAETFNTEPEEVLELPNTRQ